MTVAVCTNDVDPDAVSYPAGQDAVCETVVVPGVQLPPPVGVQPYAVGFASICATVGEHVVGHVPGDTHVMDVGTVPV